MLKRRNTIFVAVLAILAAASGTNAQVTAEQQAAVKSSCRSDFMSNCRSVRPGGIEALQCLQKNAAVLSPACKTAVDATMPKPATPKPAAAVPAAPPRPAPAAPPPKTAEPVPAPAPAIVTAKPPSASIVAPSASRPTAAKPAAAPKPAVPQQAALPPVPPAEAPPVATAAQMNAIKTTCRGDFTRSCKGVSPGTPEALACLQRNAAKLSPNCQTSLADLGDSVPPPGAPPVTTQRPNAPVIMTAVIGRACLRDLVRRCRDTGIGDGQKIACLQANEAKLAPLCKAALKGTASIR